MQKFAFFNGEETREYQVTIFDYVTCAIVSCFHSESVMAAIPAAINYEYYHTYLIPRGTMLASMAEGTQLSELLTRLKKILRYFYPCR